ncbi:hypothetical protein BaRGS_00037122, partial [Batillaria attramentaria]
SVSEVSMDVIGQRLASRETGTRHGKGYSVFYIYYYPANTLYVIQDGACQTHKLSGNISIDCDDYPDQYAIERLNEALGPYIGGTWCRGVRGDKNGVGYFSSTDLSSVPLMDERQGIVEGVPTYTVSNYYDVTLGIRDPDIFTPPTECITVR